MDTVVPPPIPTPGVDLDAIALIQQGALSTYPLLLCSIIVFAVLLERLWSLRGMIASIAQLCGSVIPLLARGDVKAAGEAVAHGAGPAQRVFADLLTTPPTAAREDLERIAENRQFEEIQGCGAYLWILGTIGSSAPFVGLFGTVMGIIRAFHSMALAGTGGFGVVAGGISEALIATALGLAVGIMAVVSYNYLQARVERIDAALRIGSDRMLEVLDTARGAHGA